MRSLWPEFTWATRWRWPIVVTFRTPRVRYISHVGGHPVPYTKDPACR